MIYSISVNAVLLCGLLPYILGRPSRIERRRLPSGVILCHKEALQVLNLALCHDVMSGPKIQEPQNKIA